MQFDKTRVSELLNKGFLSPDTSLGSARFDRYGLIKPEELDEYSHALIFGESFSGTPSAPERALVGMNCKRHFLTAAPTRSGKGVSLIIPNLLHYSGNCIVIDPKGENAWTTAQYRRMLKQEVYIIDPWGEVNRRYGDAANVLEKVARFNPLSILDPTSPHYADDLAYIADALIINQGKDPHWDDSARELVAGLISYCVESYGEAATLPMVRLLLSKPLEAIAGIAADAQKFGHESVAARKLGRFVAESKEIGSIVSTALTQTAFLDSATLGASLEMSDFDINDIIEKPCTIYLVLPVDKLHTYGRWLRLMVSIGIRTVARCVHKMPAPVLFVLDEFGTIGKLSAVAQAFGLMAGLQMCLWAFVQDFVQLKRDYPDDWETFIGNSDTVTAFNVMDQFTARYIADMLGTTTVERISEATAEQREGGFLQKSNPAYSSMKDQVFGRDLLQPHELRTLSDDLGVMVSRYGNSKFLQVPYFKNVVFNFRARENPFYPRSKEEKEAIETYAKALWNKYLAGLYETRTGELAETIPNFETALLWFKLQGKNVEKKGLVGAAYNISGIGEKLTKEQVTEAARRGLFEQTTKLPPSAFDYFRKELAAKLNALAKR